MRFLCLHGMGTNSKILESQLAPICAHLEAEGHGFVYVDGLIECDAADGKFVMFLFSSSMILSSSLSCVPSIRRIFSDQHLIRCESEVSSFYPGPYRCYYNLPTPNLVRQAHEFVQDVMEEEGPFEGVIGFSQGAALASSMMLQHAKSKPLDDMFKLAIFAGASLPYNLDDATRSGQHEANIPETPGKEQPGDGPRGFPSKPGETLEPFLGRYHPEKEETRITMPTLHIVGDQDQFAPQSRLLAKLCVGDVRTVNHNSGHRIPRDRQFQHKAVTALDGIVHSVLFRM